MNRFVLAAAAALLATPLFVAPAAADPAIKLAQADVNVRVGPGGVSIRSDADRRRYHRYRHYRDGRHHYGYYRGDRCRTTTVWRNGERTTIRRCR
jgi:hypothetical protein